MNYKIEINEDQNEDIVILAKSKTAVLGKIEELLCAEAETVIGYGENEALRLKSTEIYCFFIKDGKVLAQTRHGQLRIKERLYQLEEIFSKSFIKINQSCLINSQEIKSFSSSIGGTLFVTLKNGYKDYVARRQLKQVKERLGI